MAKARDRIMTTFLDWFKERHSEYQAVLFDIDGTMANGQKPLPGNCETIEYLRSIEFPFFFLTNDGIHSHAQKVKQLERGGVWASEDEIVSASDALVSCVLEMGLVGKKVVVIGAGGGQDEYLSAAGAVPVRIDELDECSAIFVGESKFDWFTDIHKCINHAWRHPETRFLISCPDTYWIGQADGSLGIGAGGIARFILNVLGELGITPESRFLGKPNPGIFLATIERLKSEFGIKDVENRRLIMVGDALFSDICGANRLGMTSALVMTGLTTQHLLDEAQGDSVPDLVFSTLG